MTEKIKFSENEKSHIKDLYLIDKKTIIEISNKYNISVTPIKRVLKEKNVDIRSPYETSRKYFLNESYFDDIDSFDKSYFFGLLMADGYNSEKRGCVTLVLKKIDRDILEKFRYYLETDKPLIEVKNKNASDTCRMDICSRNISVNLSNYGCMQAKTFKLEFPCFLRGNLIRHFIRGYFDGDGCVSYSFAKRDNFFGNSFLSVVTFTSTENFCVYLKKYIKKVLGVNSTMLCRDKSRCNNIRTLQISGNKQVALLLTWMYEGVDLYMERKHDKFMDILNIKNKRSVIVSGLRSGIGRKNIRDVNMKRQRKLA